MKVRDVPVDDEKLPVMRMGTYVNPELAITSDYFGALNKMMKCVEANASVTDPAMQEKVCAKEFKNLRLQAFE